MSCITLRAMYSYGWTPCIRPHRGYQTPVEIPLRLCKPTTLVRDFKEYIRDYLRGLDELEGQYDPTHKTLLRIRLNGERLEETSRLSVPVRVTITDGPSRIDDCGWLYWNVNDSYVKLHDLAKSWDPQTQPSIERLVSAMRSLFLTEADVTTRPVGCSVDKEPEVWTVNGRWFDDKTPAELKLAVGATVQVAHRLTDKRLVQLMDYVPTGITETVLLAIEEFSPQDIDIFVGTRNHSLRVNEAMTILEAKQLYCKRYQITVPPEELQWISYDEPCDDDLALFDCDIFDGRHVYRY